MEQLMYQNIAGYPTVSSANLLKQGPIFKVILDESRLASQSSLSRFWDHISEENISQLQDLNQAMIDKVRLARKYDGNDLWLGFDPFRYVWRTREN
jgi:hypothetical protein